MGGLRRRRSWLIMAAALVLVAWVAIALAESGHSAGTGHSAAVDRSGTPAALNGTDHVAPGINGALSVPGPGSGSGSGAIAAAPPTGGVASLPASAGLRSVAPPVGTPVTSGGAATLPGDDLVGPKVVENASVDLTVRHGSLDRVVSQLTDLASAEGGFVTGTDTSSGSGSPTAQLTLRIPNAQYAAALQDIRSLGKITSLESSGQDVTGQYVDLQSQIEALQDSQRQYETIMTKATTVGEILAVQAQLDSINSELQQLEGQRNVLDDQTSYATISVWAVAAPAPGQKPQPRPATGLARAWQRATSGFADGFDGLVAAAGPLAFVLALLAALGLLAKVGWNVAARRRHPRGAAASAG